jgi:hypothetical protein
VNTSGGGVSLTWGIKESFREYLEMLPDARTEVSSGASLTAEGLLAFPLERAVDVNGGTCFQFSGTVAITAHGGELSVVVSRPEVVLTGSGGRLRISAREGDIAHLSDVTRSSHAITAVCELSAEGAIWLLAGYYQEGDLLDPITLVLSGAENTDGSLTRA